MMVMMMMMMMMMMHACIYHSFHFSYTMSEARRLGSKYTDAMHVTYLSPLLSGSIDK